eukprot:CAMPEP_0174749614 /NCGR_PEP_ID=MMETSP1094-20130205/96045_1 /TAXON_ID=156173 /ORGANISM="Chrysochromulina brevifilum, Strain UTEX LB 985" /LENGTH=71 /DNA_ID=CAMNT_0015954843 /DNA_START=163 /DNA_END=374 /DNA_ORIENTATION=-
MSKSTRGVRELYSVKIWERIAHPPDVGIGEQHRQVQLVSLLQHWSDLGPTTGLPIRTHLCPVGTEDPSASA